MQNSQKFDDPLSGLAFAQEDEDIDEEIPFDDPPGNPPQTGFKDADANSRQPLLQPEPQQQAPGPQQTAHQSHGSKSAHNNQDPYSTTRLDTVASYGQLVTPHDSSDSQQSSAYQASSKRQEPRSQPALDEAGPSSSTTQSTQQGPRPQITVNDPQKHAERNMIGVSAGYVTYAVKSFMHLPKYSSRGALVRRRFRDFVALADLLKISHRGFFIPPRPDKNAVEGGRASEEFVELRRVALEHYVLQLAAHPAIVQSDALRVFLEAEAPLGSNLQWQQLQPLHGSILEGVARLPKQLFGQDAAAPSPTEAAQNTKHTSDLLRRFKELTVKETKDASSMDQSEVDLKNEKLIVDEFLDKVAAASRGAERLVSKFEEMGSVTGDLGLSAIALAKFEDSDGTQCGAYTDSAMASRTISADSKRVGMAGLRVSRLSKTATSSTAVALTPLHDNLALAPAAAKALKEREAALLTLQAIEADLEKRRHSVVILEEESQRLPGDKARSRKLENLKNEVASLQAAVQAASQEYGRVKQRNLQEVARWKESRVKDFDHMLDDFARIMSAYEDRTLSVWLEVAEQFGISREAAAQLSS